jgi:hypothetical protein
VRSVRHAQHEHTPEIEQWRREAAELISQHEMRESLAASIAHRDEVLADLKRRAGSSKDDTDPRLAAMPSVSPSH